jgi:hypothetical protein
VVNWVTELCTPSAPIAWRRGFGRASGLEKPTSLKQLSILLLENGNSWYTFDRMNRAALATQGKGKRDALHKRMRRRRFYLFGFGRNPLISPDSDE